MHFKGLDLNLLVILDALLEEQSVTKAAERVHVSQPAVSAALAKLRQHTGDELLEKVGREYRLTPRAQIMVKPVKEILLQIDSTIYSGAEFDSSKSDRTFNIAMSSYAAEILMPGVVDKLTMSYPGISCVVELLQTDSFTRLNNGSLDAAITFQQANKLLNSSESIEELNYVHIYSDEWVLIAAKDNDRVTEKLSYEEFCLLPYVETRFGRIQPSFVERTLDSLNYRPRANVAVPSFELAITNVINSPAVTVVPALMIEEYLRPFLKSFKPPFAMPVIEEFLVWHSRNDADPGHAWFRDLMLGVGRELSPG